jgi:phosphoribulokinase
MIIIVEKKQSLWDLALQYYGSIEGIYQLWDDNTSVINNLNSDVVPGQKLVIDESRIIKPEIATYFKEKNIKIATAE